ncbi:MAG: hypothetical protein P9X24_08345 [Candidatus Hatepunaea meridiana]|nr:hypothetical protein [Candidatus Hatepunaea meridiana]
MSLDSLYYSIVSNVPYKQQVIYDSPYEVMGEQLNLNSQFESAYGRIYCVRSPPPTFLETISRLRNWKRAIPGGDPISDYFLSISISAFVMILLITATIIIDLLFVRLSKSEKILISGQFEQIKYEYEKVNRKYTEIENHFSERIEKLNNDKQDLIGRINSLTTNAKIEKSKSESEKDALEKRNRNIEDELIEELSKIEDELSEADCELVLQRHMRETLESENEELRKNSNLSKIKLDKNFSLYYPGLQFTKSAQKEALKCFKDPGVNKLTHIFVFLCVHKGVNENLRKAGIRFENVKGLENTIELKYSSTRVYYCACGKKPHIRAIQLYKNATEQNRIIKNLKSACQICAN